MKSGCRLRKWGMTGSEKQSKILLTGGGGHLAGELLNIDHSIEAPTRELLDFSTYEGMDRYCAGKDFSIVIHAGAVTNKFSEDVDEEYIRSNIIGTSNVVLWCIRHKSRLVYISSDYVYPSERGGYTEESVLLPVNRYATSKLGGEMAVQLHSESLIIRTSFYSTLDFDKGCTYQLTSRISIREAALAVYQLALKHDVRGIINVGSRTKRSVFEIIKTEFNRSVDPITRSSIKISYRIPPDSSMDTLKFQRVTETETVNSRHVTQCRICHSENLYRYLGLGRTPLANSYLSDSDLSSSEFTEELALQVCLKCGLSQLTRVVHPDLMFKNYLYVSSTTRTFQDHCVELAQTATAVVQGKSGDLALDIASNDGCLLSKFRDLNMNVIGVDPAENLAAEANASGIHTLCAYWSVNIARDIAARFGSPKIITATNVFAHVDDMHGFVEAVGICLAQDGIFVIEFPYVIDFIEKNEFDTAYHEHLSYVGIRPVSQLMGMHGLQVFDVQYFKDIHGGTVRIFVSRSNHHAVRKSVGEYLKREEQFGITEKERYSEFARRVEKNGDDLRAMVRQLRTAGRTIWAYGASAKGNTLMNFFRLTSSDIPVVIDDNQKKWGLYSPGSRMKIVGIDDLRQHHVDYLLLLAWNYKNEIMRRCSDVDYRGYFIVPVPTAAIVPHR